MWLKEKMDKHYKEKLSSFVNHELPKDEQRTIGEHLLLCADCRAEHDEIKFGAMLANQLNQANVPENLWNKIENSLDKRDEKVFPTFAFFGSRTFAPMAGLLIVDRKSTRLNSSHGGISRMPSSA